MVERLRKELSANKETETGVRQQLFKCESDLNALRERERALNELSQEQAATLEQLQRELRNERSNAAEASKLLQQSKQAIVDYERQVSGRDRQTKELQVQVSVLCVSLSLLHYYTTHGLSFRCVC